MATKSSLQDNTRLVVGAGLSLGDSKMRLVDLLGSCEWQAGWYAPGVGPVPLARSGAYLRAPFTNFDILTYFCTNFSITERLV